MRCTLFTAVALLVVGCGSGTAPGAAGVVPSSPVGTQEQPSERDTTASPADGPEQPVSATAATGPSLRALDPQPLVGPAPRVRVLSPRDGQLIARGPVLVRLELDHWELEPAPGNHVHLKVDNREEIAVHDLSAPIPLDQRYQTRFDEPLPEGSHVLRVLLSRANHESVKLPTAFKVLTFHYRSRTPGFRFDQNRPLLTYSRPQGCAADSVRLLDFFVSNLNSLSPTGYRVQLDINQEHRWVIADWVPHRLDALPEGPSIIRLQLLAPDGSPVPGPFNDTSREVSGRRGCPELGLVPDDDADEDDEYVGPGEAQRRRGAIAPDPLSD